MNYKIKIEFRHFHGCPNSPKLWDNLNSATLGLEGVKLLETLIDTDEKAKAVCFLGSPSILINGVDLLEVEPPENPSLTCRYYPDGLPSAEFIRNKILTIVKKNE